MAKKSWDPSDNPYTWFVRVERGVLRLHEEMWTLLEEIAGRRPALTSPAELLALVDGEIARLSSETRPKQVDVAEVHLAELRLLREALLDAMAEDPPAADDGDPAHAAGRRQRRLH